MERKFRSFTFTIPMRFRDLDAYGHVNNADVFTYLEEARIRLIADRFDTAMSADTIFLVRSASCEYLKPILYSPLIMIRLHTEDLGRASFSVSYEVRKPEDELLYATAKTTMVCVDPVTSGPTPVPDWLRTRLVEPETL